MALPFVGNNDFRGYLAALAKQGDGRAQIALNGYNGMGYVDNSGNINEGLLRELNQAAPGAGVSDEQLQNDARGYIQNAYKTWSNASKPAAAPNPNGGDLAYLDDQEGLLRGLLGSAQRTLGNGLTQIGDSYNKEVSRANEGQGAALSKIATQREDTTRGKTAALDKVDTGARTLADSVRRILGLAGGSNSSAYQFAAPGAIARDASTKRTGVMDTFGRNFRDLDTAETGTKSSYSNLLQDLLDQRKQKEQGLREGVLQQEQGVYNDLANVARQRAQAKGGGYGAIRAASAPYQAEVQNRQSALDNIFNQFRTPYNVAPVSVQTPQLSDYTVDKTAIAPNTQDGNGSTESVYSSFLRKKLGLAEQPAY